MRTSAKIFFDKNEKIADYLEFFYKIAIMSFTYLTHSNNSVKKVMMDSLNVLNTPMKYLF